MRCPVCGGCGFLTGKCRCPVFGPHDPYCERRPEKCYECGGTGEAQPDIGHLCDLERS